MKEFLFRLLHVSETSNHNNLEAEHGCYKKQFFVFFFSLQKFLFLSECVGSKILVNCHVMINVGIDEWCLRAELQLKLE